MAASVSFANAVLSSRGLWVRFPAILLIDGDAIRRAVELAAERQPDVVIVDLAASGHSGLGVIRQLHAQEPPVRVLVLSNAVEDASVAEALAAGADGCVRRDASAGDLVHAIREVAAGRRYLSPPWSEERLAQHRERAAAAGPDLYATLTERERQVLHLAAEGLRNREIAERLGISPRTAESHRAHLMAKLKLRREAELVRYALRRGLVPLDPGS